MITSVTFASCYVYSPCGLGPTSERSRLLRALLKASDAQFLFKYADRVRQQSSAAAPLSGFIGPDTVLVPIPGCAPRVGAGSSVTERLAFALREEGLGHSVWDGLRRARAVRKSATAAPGSRPSVREHYESFAIDTGPLTEDSPPQLMLIDDVVTKGRTLLAAAGRLHDAFPHAEIRAFALVRTMGLVAGVSRLLDPCVGQIRWRRGDAVRNP